jgi:hypothetical protein
VSWTVFEVRLQTWIFPIACIRYEENINQAIKQYLNLLHTDWSRDYILMICFYIALTLKTNRWSISVGLNPLMDFRIVGHSLRWFVNRVILTGWAGTSIGACCVQGILPPGETNLAASLWRSGMGWPVFYFFLCSLLGTCAHPVHFLGRWSHLQHFVTLQPPLAFSEHCS